MARSRLRLLVASSTLLLGGALSCRAVEPGVPLTGIWGGKDIQLELTTTGGNLLLGCGSGSLDAPLVPDNSGRVFATGMTSPGIGAPPPEGYVPPRYPRTFSGRVDGRYLTLTVRRVDDPAVTTTFSLVRGRAGIVYPCP